MSRNPTAWKPDMMLANASRTSCVAESLCIPGKYFPTTSPAGNDESRKQFANRSSAVASPSEPLQPA